MPWGRLPSWESCFFPPLLWLPNAEHHHLSFHGSFAYPTGTAVSRKYQRSFLRPQRVNIHFCQSLQISLSPKWKHKCPEVVKMLCIVQKEDRLFPILVSFCHRSFHVALSDMSPHIFAENELALRHHAECRLALPFRN